MAMPKHRQTIVHSHARLSGPFCAVRMFKIDGQSTVHRQANRLSRCYAVAGRKTGRSFADYKLFEKVGRMTKRNDLRLSFSIPLNFAVI